MTANDNKKEEKPTKEEIEKALMDLFFIGLERELATRKII